MHTLPQGYLPVTRKEARKLGTKFFCTGKPCPRGHVAVRYTSTNGCAPCLRERDKILSAKKAEARANKPLSPRQQAIAAGEIRYDPQRPCSRGHWSERWIKGGSCVLCTNEKVARAYRENSETRAKSIAYRKANAERYRTHTRNRRAALAGDPLKHTAEDVAEIIQAQGGVCVYCPTKLTKWHVDHIVPRSKGGHNGRDNIQVLCPKCNLRKAAKSHKQFLAELLKIHPRHLEL